MIFKNPIFFLLIPLVFLFIFLSRKRGSSSRVIFSSAESFKNAPKTPRLLASQNLFLLRFFSAVLFILALARPQNMLEYTRIYTEGIDIVLTIDASGSMLAEDFTINHQRQNRLEVVKIVVENFVIKRKSDRIGIVAFAGRAYTVCPLTLDYDWLVRNLERVKIGTIEDGTAVGSAIIASLNRLRDTEAKSKIIILLTDGVNNAGRISPLTAAEAARAMGVKIYTIGAGTEGPVPYPVKMWGETVFRDVKIPIDEKTLRKIAKITNGMYFRATDTKSLENIYGEIDMLERTPVEETGYREYKELFPIFLIPALIILLIEVLLGNSILRKLP